MKKCYILFWGLSVVLAILSGMQIAFAQSSQLVSVVSPGELTITAPHFVQFGTLTGSEKPQIAVATVSGVQISDLRGTGAGWAATATVTPLVLNNSYIRRRTLVRGALSQADAEKIEISGQYQPDSTASSRTFLLKIIDVAGMGNGTPVSVRITTPADIQVTAGVKDRAVSANGLTFHFPERALYQVGDEFIFSVDAFLTDQARVRVGLFEGAGMPKASINGIQMLEGPTNFPLYGPQAPVFSGVGSFNLAYNITWNIHSLPFSGSYESRLILSVN